MGTIPAVQRPTNASMAKATATATPTAKATSSAASTTVIGIIRDLMPPTIAARQGQVGVLCIFLDWIGNIS